MTDLFGREVQRGDIIVYGKLTLSGFNKFSETKLGVVGNVIQAGRKYLAKDRNGKLILDANGNKQYQSTIEKVTYYPLEVSTILPMNVRLTKHGKRKYNPTLSMKFLKINKEELTEDWKKLYDEVCRHFRIQ